MCQLYSLHSYSLRPPQHSGSDWQPVVRGRHLGPLSTVASRPITPTQLASRATSITIRWACDPKHHKFFTWSSHQSHNFFCSSTSRAFSLGSVTRAHAVRYCSSQFISVHAYSLQKSNSCVVTLPFSSAPAGAVPAYSGDITPYRMS